MQFKHTNKNFLRIFFMHTIEYIKLTNTTGNVIKAPCDSLDGSSKDLKRSVRFLSKENEETWLLVQKTSSTVVLLRRNSQGLLCRRTHTDSTTTKKCVCVLHLHRFTNNEPLQLRERERWIQIQARGPWVPFLWCVPQCIIMS